MSTTSDEQEVSIAEALAVWLPVARARLLSAAQSYGGWLTYRDLADHVQMKTGLAHTQPFWRWIRRLLLIVSDEADRLGEPRLTSLCVRADRTIGLGYPWALQASSDHEREEIAARDRLECYRRYAADFPMEGGGLVVALDETKRLSSDEAASSRRSPDNEHWLVASNVKTFDSDAAFAAMQRIDWSETKSAGIRDGDTVYLYGTAPTSAITHECVVVETGIAFSDVIDDREFWGDQQAFAERADRTWMGLQLVRVFSAAQRESLSLDVLREVGLRAAPQGRRRASGELLAHIQRVADHDGAQNRGNSHQPVRGFWWVNQPNTWAMGKDLTQLWAPIMDESGKSQAHWDSLEEAELGDVVLHYARDHIFGASRVAISSVPMPRPRSFEVGERSGDPGRSVVLTGYQLFDIPVHRDELPVDLRRAEAETGGPFDVAGRVRRGYFFPLNPASAVAVMSAAQLVVAVSDPSPRAEYAESEPGESEFFLELNSTDGVAVVRYRREQSALRSALFAGKQEDRCGICSRIYPVRYLHSAHIKSRSACTEDERKDWRNVVIPACVFGCDAMFEDGLLRVGAGGVISFAPGHDQTRALDAFTNSIVGKIAPAFTTENQKYFAWRYSKSIMERGR